MSRSHSEFSVRYIRAEKKVKRIWGNLPPEKLHEKVLESLSHKNAQRRVKDFDRRYRVAMP